MIVHPPGRSPLGSHGDPQGRFTFRGLAKNRYHLELSDFRTGLVYSRDIDLREDEEIHIDLETSSLGGTIVDQETGDPIAQAEIALVPQAPAQPVDRGQQTVSQGDGTFTFVEVAAGSWRLTVAKPGYGPVERAVALAGMEGRKIEILLTPAAAPGRGGS